MSEYIVCVDDLEESYYRYTNIKPETVFGHRLREEIVRCRDCVYFDKYENDEVSVCYRFDNEQPIVEPDGYCAWSKRKQ